MHGSLVVHICLSAKAHSSVELTAVEYATFSYACVINILHALKSPTVCAPTTRLQTCDIYECLWASLGYTLVVGPASWWAVDGFGTTCVYAALRARSGWYGGYNAISVSPRVNSGKSGFGLYHSLNVPIAIAVAAKMPLKRIKSFILNVGW